MKFLLATATALVAMVATTQAQYATVDDVPQFVEGPELFEDRSYVDESSDDVTNYNETRALRSQAGLTIGQAGDAAIATFQIAQALAPVLAGMSNKKECHQTACWVATTTENCAMAAANQVQRELMRGRNSFAVESTGPSGMWVRYWRTKFSPPDRGNVADGKCGAGTKFVVTNCQSTGKVYC